MANRKQLKEVITKYISENYSRLNEQDEDPKASIQGIINLLDSTDTRLSTLIRDINSPENKLMIIDKVLDYVLDGFNTTADIPPATLRNHFIQKFGGDEKDGMDDIADAPETDAEEIEEMSTTAGAPAPATKYAFKRKKK